MGDSIENVGPADAVLGISPLSQPFHRIAKAARTILLGACPDFLDFLPLTETTMTRTSAGCLAFAFLGLASLQAQTIYPPEATECWRGCAVPRPAAPWPYGYYPTMWGQGVPYGYYRTSWTQGVCPGMMPMDGLPGMPVPGNGQPVSPGEQLGAPRPLPSKN